MASDTLPPAVADLWEPFGADFWPEVRENIHRFRETLNEENVMPELSPAVAEAQQHCPCGGTGKTSTVIGIPSGGMRRVERPCPYCAAILAALDAARAEVWRECAEVLEREAQELQWKQPRPHSIDRSEEVWRQAAALRARGETP